MSVDDSHYGMEEEEKAKVAKIEQELLDDEEGFLPKHLAVTVRVISKDTHCKQTNHIFLL